MATVSLIAFVLCALTDWVAVTRSARKVEYVAKPATLVALLAYAATGSADGGWLLVALACSLLGDVLLMLPADVFAAGLAAFLAAHLAYVAAFDAPVVHRLVWLAVVLVVMLPVSRAIVRSVRPAGLRLAVVLYVIAIATMAGSALASGSAVASAGAVLFLASDAMIAWNRFVRPFAWARVAIIVTYHVGQLGLVSALR